MQVVGDDIYIYYVGCPNIYSAWPAHYAITPERRGSQFAPTYLGLAILRRDRYAYASGSGTITTHPLNISGDVWLNADGRDIKMQVLDNEGQPITTGGLSPQLHDGVYRAVQWEDAAPTGEVQLRIELNGGKLYSVRY